MPPRGAPERLAPRGWWHAAAGSGDHVAARDAVRLDNGRVAVGSLGDSPVFGADLRFFRTRRVRSCPPMPAGSRYGTDQGKPGRGEHASRHGGSRPPAALRGLAAGQPPPPPELGPP